MPRAPRTEGRADPANVAARNELRARIDRLAAEIETGAATRAAVRAHLDRIDARAGAPPED